MSSDHTLCVSSPRGGGGGGLCKALKEMKSKVASHTGMSLSFVELVANSPAVGLLPALAPSPRSPSALLHRRMHLHSNYTFVARRSSSTEQSTCVHMENMGRLNTCTDVETEDVQSSCATAAVDGDSRPGIKLSCMSPMLCDVSYGCLPSACQVCHMSCENPSSCNLSCEHPLSSSSACSLTCAHQLSSFSSCNLSCRQPSSCVLLSWDPSSSSMSCSCHVSCGHPSSSSSCDLSCGHSSSSSACDFSCGHQSSLLLSSRDLSSGQPSSSSNNSCASAELVSGMDISPADSNNVDCCTTLHTSSTGKHATTILRVKSQIPSTSARVLYFIVTLFFALSSISKSFYKSCLWGANISRRLLHLHTLMHYIRVMISAGFVKTKREDGGHGNEMEGMKVVGQQSLQGSKTSCMKRSKLLKSKLRSSFKSLSVQVPRKAFAPLHFNTFPLSSSSSSSSSSMSSLSSSSASSSNSPAVNGSPIARRTRTLRSPSFARKLTKSFNQRQPCTVSQISPVLPASHMQSSPTSHMVCSHPSSCEFSQYSPNRSTSLNKSGDSMVAPFVALPLALCTLFYGKLVAFITVTAWLLIVSIASSVCFSWRNPSQICSPS